MGASALTTTGVEAQERLWRLVQHLLEASPKPSWQSVGRPAVLVLVQFHKRLHNVRQELIANQKRTGTEASSLDQFAGRGLNMAQRSQVKRLEVACRIALGVHRRSPERCTPLWVAGVRPSHILKKEERAGLPLRVKCGVDAQNCSYTWENVALRETLVT